MALFPCSVCAWWFAKSFSETKEKSSLKLLPCFNSLNLAARDDVKFYVLDTIATKEILALRDST
jgi:hypothetical protein